MSGKAPASEAPDAGLLRLAVSLFATARPVRLGVAVSGGSDSMAMLHLLARAAPKGTIVHAVSVDHGLRPEAAAEAHLVAGACRKIGISHETLRWRHGTVAGNLQAAARRARYGLIAEWARSRGVSHVAIGHTADDQAETFLMELAREAGLDGLSAMAPVWQAEGTCWCRPFLRATRVELRGFLERHGIGWIDDPSNENDRYARVRARKALKSLAPLGITAERLRRTASNLSAARQVVEQAAGDAARQIGREIAGEVILDRPGFLTLAPETGRRLVIGALQWVSGTEYPPRSASVARIIEAIAERRQMTLAGCRIRVGEGEIRILREYRAVAGQIAGPGEIWDRRWRVSGPGLRGGQVRALGPDGLRLCPDWRQIGASREALIASPAVWKGASLRAAPLAGWPNGWQALPTFPFAAAFQRH